MLLFSCFDVSVVVLAVMLLGALLDVCLLFCIACGIALFGLRL